MQLYHINHAHMTEGPYYHLQTKTDLGRVAKTFTNEALEALNMPSGAKILDVGSSVGYTTAEIGQLFGSDVKVMGLDLNPNVLGKSARNAAEYYQPDNPEALLQRILFLRGDGYRSMFKSGSIDCVVVMNNLTEMIKRDDTSRTSSEFLPEIIGNLCKLIKPNGYLMIGSTSSKVAHIYQKQDDGQLNRIFHRQDFDKSRKGEYLDEELNRLFSEVNNLQPEYQSI